MWSRSLPINFLFLQKTNWLPPKKRHQARTPYDAHPRLHGDGDCLCPSGTGPCFHCRHHSSVERGTGTPGHGSPGFASSIRSEKPRDGGSSWVGGGPAVAPLWRTLGELPAGGALGAEAVLACGRSVSERSEGPSSTRLSPHFFVPLRHRYCTRMHWSPLLDGYTPERGGSYRWSPGGDVRVAQLDSTRRVHPQPR